MADQGLITLYPGQSPSTEIVLRPLPVADPPTTTTIYLRPGDASPTTVVLRDPRVGPVGGGLTVDCSVAGTGATGVPCAVVADTTIVCAVGSALSTGLSANIDRRIETAHGVATAAGVWAKTDRSVDASVGLADAHGVPAAIGSSLACSVGAAGAVGVQASVGRAIDCVPGNAWAAGVGATIQSSSNTTVNCHVAVALATGQPTEIDAEILSAPGLASAGGVVAAIGRVVEAAPAIGAANGVAALVQLATSISFSAGSASALGVAASVSNGAHAPDPRLDQILALLTGRKIYDSATKLWRVYDAGGIELADPGGTLLRGLHGWLLQANAQSTDVVEYAARIGGGGSDYFAAHRATILDEDDLVLAVIMASVTQGIII